MKTVSIAFVIVTPVCRDCPPQRPFQGRRFPLALDIGTKKEIPPTIGRLWRTLHYAASGRGPNHRPLQVGWSRFRAVLMVCIF